MVCYLWPTWHVYHHAHVFIVCSWSCWFALAQFVLALYLNDRSFRFISFLKRTNIYKSSNYLYSFGYVLYLYHLIYVCEHFPAKTVNSLWIQAVFGLTLVVDSGRGEDWMLVNSSLPQGFDEQYRFSSVATPTIYRRWMKTSKKKASNKKVEIHFRFHIPKGIYSDSTCQCHHICLLDSYSTRLPLNRKKNTTYIQPSKPPNAPIVSGGIRSQTETKRDVKTATRTHGT